MRDLAANGARGMSNFEFVFSLLVIILVFKPTGLLGQETGEKA